MAAHSKGRKSTIYDIALAVGSSPTTVSFVLNGAWKRHRITQATAARVLECADRLGYAVNLKARGLRLSRSGLAGMIVPHYRNRFFAGLAEAFQAEARARGLCPVVVSTHRHPANELKVTETLLAQMVEFLFIAGVHDPDPLNELCRAAGVPCVNVDLPGTAAPSVVSDNRTGARILTDEVIKRMIARGGDPADIFFFGGVLHDNATSNRVAGFFEALSAHHIAAKPEMVYCCGYPPSSAARCLSARYEQLGRLPGGLFVNGVTALEGALRFTSTLPASALQDVVVGSFDWDPFAAHLPFEVIMVRQDVEAIITKSFGLLENYLPGHNPLVFIPTRITAFDENDGLQEDWEGDGISDQFG